MLEVQLCRRSPLGALVPIGRTTAPDVVRQVADAIRRELDAMRFDDAMLDDVAAVERDKFASHIAHEEVKHAN